MEPETVNQFRQHWLEANTDSFPDQITRQSLEALAHQGNGITEFLEIIKEGNDE